MFQFLYSIFYYGVLALFIYCIVWFVKGFLSKQNKEQVSDNLRNDQAVIVNELIPLVSFAQKIKPLMSNNHGIKVYYSKAKENGTTFTSKIIADLLIDDWGDLTLAKKSALKAGSFEASARMAEYYYNRINEQAGITRNDWPYSINHFAFTRMLINHDDSGLVSLIPHDCDDMFTMRLVVGLSSESGNLTCHIVERECTAKFPNLTIKDKYSTPTFFCFTIDI